MNNKKQSMDEISSGKSLVGLSNSIDKLRQDIPKMAKFIAQKNAKNSILVTGHSGVGKTVLIDLILEECRRKFKRESMIFDCSAIEPNLIRSELFGYKKGAFTGALNDRIGLLKEADGQILFLDEIGNISPDIQKALLLAIEGRQIIPVGGRFANDGFRANFGLISATNKGIRSSSEFAKELYYRISLWPVEIPPLSDRKIDIIPLISDILEKHQLNNSKPATQCWSLANLYALMGYNWNVGGYRELEQEVLYLVREGKLSPGFIRAFEKSLIEEPTYEKTMPINEILSQLGTPDEEPYAARNLRDLIYWLHGGRTKYKFRFQQGKLDFAEITRFVTNLQWADQQQRISSRSIYHNLKENPLQVYPMKLLELVNAEIQYYTYYRPEIFPDPRTDFKLDLFFMGLICNYQSLKPNKYIPYMSFKLAKDDHKDVNSEKIHELVYEFPTSDRKQKLFQGVDFPKLNAESDDQKTLNTLLTRYGYSNIVNDLKALIPWQKENNHLSWEDIRNKHGIDRRSLRASEKDRKE